MPKPLKCACLIHSLAPSETNNNPRTNAIHLTKRLQLQDTGCIPPSLLSEQIVKPVVQAVLQGSTGRPDGGLCRGFCPSSFRVRRWEDIQLWDSSCLLVAGRSKRRNKGTSKCRKKQVGPGLLRDSCPFLLCPLPSNSSL